MKNPAKCGIITTFKKHHCAVHQKGFTYMKHTYFPKGVCPIKIEFDLDGDIVSDIVFTGGCNGNLKAISKIVDGWTVDAIADAFTGNTCGFKPTSCADQLAKAVTMARNGAR